MHPAPGGDDLRVAFDDMRLVKGGMRVAMRVGTGLDATGLKLILSDHLGSTVLTADAANGNKLSEIRYKPWGEARFLWSTTTSSYRFTGQRMEGIGLYDFHARWYDPQLGRFTSPDTIIPGMGNVQAWDRYAYANNNPARYNDPTGHAIDDGCSIQGCTGDPNATVHIIYMGGFPAVIAPNSSSLASRAEDTYDPQGRPDPFAPLGLVNDALEQGLHYKYQHDPSTIHAYLRYEENSDGSISMTSLDIWNRSSANVSVGSVDITANPNPCNRVCLSGPSYNYMAIPPTIGSPNAGIGVVAPNSYGQISLIPSGSTNPSNSFIHNYTINVTVRFNQYFPGYDNTAHFRMLRSEINW